MMYKCFLDLAVWPAAAVVKVDETGPGIVQATEAGSWAVGVALTDNAAGLSEAELVARDAVELFLVRTAAACTLHGAGAHYVIDGVADLMPILDEIASGLARGERPPQASGS